MLWWVPLLPALLAPLFAMAAPRASRTGAALGAGLAMAATTAVAAWAALAGWEAGYAVGAGLRLDAALDPRAATVAVTVPAVALPVLVYAAAHEARAGLGRLLALLVFFVAAMELLVVAADLLTLLVGWELVGACSWALIGHAWHEGERPRAATRAFVAVRFGDLGLFLAAAALFAGAGRFGYSALAEIPPPTQAIVAFGVLLAAAAKSAQLPFSPWLFAAMAGPTSVSALLHAATMVAAGAYLLARLEPWLAPVPWFAPAVLGLGLATALAGGLVAVLQGHSKKLLAASTSAHQGLMWVAVGAGLPAVAILHLVAHAFFKAQLFLAAGLADACRGGFVMHRLRVGAALPASALASALGAAALAGVPPLGGAWSKEAVVTAAGHHAAWAALLAALAGGLSACYAARFQLLVFGRGDTRCGERRPGRIERGGVAALAAVSVALGLAWWPGARAALAAMLEARIPPAKAWELATSLGLVALGLAAGGVLAARRPQLGTAGAVADAADWLGLPALARRAFLAPTAGLCHALARFDDRVVEAGVRAAGRAGTALARLGERRAEPLLDGARDGLARALDAGGRALRRGHTGFSHHQYAVVATGLLLLVAVLAAGARAC